MEQKLAKIFKEMREIQPNVGLEGLILQKIDLENSRQMKRKLIFSYFGMAVSFSTGVLALIYSGSAFLKSEFWSILFLTFSDFMAVVESRNEYLYSLGETLPIAHIVAILVPIFAILMFLNLYFSLKNRNKYIHMHNNLKFIS